MIIRCLLQVSANEYSFEDKVNKVGKFTDALTKGAGIDGQLLADMNIIDGHVSLEEIYNYIDKNVIYTSHIQAYPKMSSFWYFLILSRCN